MTVLAVYNIKGGVGKTTTAVNLASLAASEGLRTLVWDLDPVGSASYCLNVKSHIKGGASKLLSDKRHGAKVVKRSHYENLDVLPADFSYRNLALELKSGKKSKSSLRRVLKPLRQSYDYIFIDCPPGITPVTESILSISDVVLAPVIPADLSISSLDQLTNFIEAKKYKQLKVLPFLTMVDQRRKLHKVLTASLRETQPGLLESLIPNSTVVEQMGSRRAALNEFASTSEALTSYRQLWLEIKQRLQPDMASSSQHADAEAAA